MGGGLMQLVAYGAQDIYLTGNPQITFFKVVYRRHTNFSMEAIEQSASGVARVTQSENEASFTVARNGDLIHKVYLTADASQHKIQQGSQIIKEVEISIGGQKIDRHTQEWHDIWNELTITSSKSKGFKAMTGDIGKGGHSDTQLVNSSMKSVKYVQIPLLFWFCRNPGLALPLIALQYHEVKIDFTFNILKDIGNHDDDHDELNLKLFVDYIYLDTDERRRFAQVSHEYLIEQLQLQEEGSSRDVFKLNFDHPIKELIWTVPTSTTESSTIITQKMKIEINGHDRFAYQDREYFQIKQPLIHHTAVPGYNIKEKDTIEMIQPIVIAYRDSGTATGTDVTTLHNTVGSTSGTKTTFNFLIGTNFIPSVNSSNFPKVGDLLNIEIKDQDEATAARQRNIIAQVSSVASQTNGWNIGLVTEDDQDAISSNFIVGTANDDLVSISIIGRLQNPKSRCSQLSRDIFVYSFALSPEEHQPSGACNFSRIESAKFLLDNAGTISNIYAVNYNVLRIMSGMGGLAYAI